MEAVRLVFFRTRDLQTAKHQNSIHILEQRKDLRPKNQNKIGISIWRSRRFNYKTNITKGDWSLFGNLSICSLLWIQLSISFGSITAITKNNGDNESTRKIPLWIFTSDRGCLVALNSTIQFSRALVMRSIICSDILNNFRHSSTHVCIIVTDTFLTSIYAMTVFSRPCLYPLQNVLLYM